MTVRRWALEGMAPEVPVEVRLWRSADPENHLVRAPVSERGLLVADHPRSAGGEPVLVVGGEAYPPWSEEAFAGVLLVLSAPTVEEAALLHTAAAVGYAIEPRVVGEPWQDIDRLR
jgi:hypothetical protein